jgi:hypothetical protein
MERIEVPWRRVLFGERRTNSWYVATLDPASPACR